MFLSVSFPFFFLRFIAILYFLNDVEGVGKKRSAKEEVLEMKFTKDWRHLKFKLGKGLARDKKAS